MSDRYTRKDAEAAFARLASACGATWSDRSGALWQGLAYKPEAAGSLWTRTVPDDHTLSARVGAWTLDYNPAYGGYVIEVMGNTGGGVSQPFGSMRHSAREFCAMVRFVMDTLAVIGDV